MLLKSNWTTADRQKIIGGKESDLATAARQLKGCKKSWGGTIKIRGAIIDHGKKIGSTEGGQWNDINLWINGNSNFLGEIMGTFFPF